MPKSRERMRRKKQAIHTVRMTEEVYAAWRALMAVMDEAVVARISAQLGFTSKRRGRPKKVL